MSTSDKKTYMSKGQVLDRPPLTVRISRFFENAYIFFGLYFVSLIALDPYLAAQNSQFNVTLPATPGTRPRWGGGGGGGSYGPGGGGGGGGPGRRIGRVADVSDIPGPSFAGGGCGC